MRLSFCAACALTLVMTGTVAAQPVVNPVATYQLQDSYAADQPGKPALNPFAPGASTLSFVTDTVAVGGVNPTRTVLNRGGAGGEAPANQAGVELNATTLLTSPNVYSIDMVFSLTAFGTFERILNTNDASDQGLYAHGNAMSLFDGTSHDGTHFVDVRPVRISPRRPDLRRNDGQGIPRRRLRPHAGYAHSRREPEQPVPVLPRQFHRRVDQRIRARPRRTRPTVGRRLIGPPSGQPGCESVY